jgi:phosphoglycolate phosphatase
MNKKIYFITNNSTKTRDEFVQKAQSLNFKVGQENIISTAYLAAQYLKQRDFAQKVYVVGSTGISQELDLVGIRHCGVGPDPMTCSVADLKDNFVPEKDIGAVVCGFNEHIVCSVIFSSRRSRSRTQNGTS